MFTAANWYPTHHLPARPTPRKTTVKQHKTKMKTQTKQTQSERFPRKRSRECQTSTQIQHYLMAIRILQEFFSTSRISTMSIVCVYETNLLAAKPKLSMIVIGSAHVNIEGHARVFLQHCDVSRDLSRP